METVKELLKNIFPQEKINTIYHLPVAILANVIYGFPTRGLKVIGITGTDGKTTTTNMVYQILKAAGKKVSMVSTINAMVAGKPYDTGFHVTSPDPFTVQKFAREAFNRGSEYLVLEVTSHGLDQFRFWGIRFEIGVITNVTHEHLDYHRTYKNYLADKLKLLKGVKFAIINQNLKNHTGKLAGKIMTFGFQRGDFNQQDIKLNLKITGEYNLENALCSLATAFVLGIDKTIAQKALENFKNVKGRMEEIENNRNIKIVVDFAHTPNALEQALKSLRKKTKGRLIAVFGSAGKRDIEKRSLMGQIAGKLADISVITAEDPRGELDLINKQIADGAKKVGGVMDKNIFVLKDRKKAIDFAINNLAKAGDTIGIFGKGHEASMNLDGKIETSWSEKEAVELALSGFTAAVKSW
ncbi:hypothetical protein KKE78_00760 [Patescibacteria group bacterium]|nr:hypothetical protein [Patescibacteria group bacterium]